MFFITSVPVDIEIQIEHSDGQGSPETEMNLSCLNNHICMTLSGGVHKAAGFA